MSERERMLSGALYDPADPELSEMRIAAADWMQRVQAAAALPADARFEVLQEGLGAIGTGSDIRPPFFVDYGVHIELGARVFINFNCVILDVCPVKIGDDTMLGPGVQILTADHPREAQMRISGRELGQAIRIGARCWIGAGALILPGCNIGDEAIVGAGAVVTRDVPPGMHVAGNPARPIRA